MKPDKPKEKINKNNQIMKLPWIIIAIGLISLNCVYPEANH